MKRSRVMAGLVILGLALTAFPSWAGENAGGGKMATVTGEVIDTACYFAKGLRGKGHAKCAKFCIKEGGVPAGLLTDDGQIYILAVNAVEDATPLEKIRNEYSDAKRITVTGMVIEKGGVKLLFVKDVKLAP